MRKQINATKLVIAGLAIGLGALSLAQDDGGVGGGTLLWQKVLDTPVSVTHFTLTLPGHGVPGGYETHVFQELFKVWETINEETAKTAPWDVAFATLLNWMGTARVTALCDEFGNCSWSAYFEDCFDDGHGGSPAVQRWLYNPTNKKQERKSGYLDVVQNPGGGQ